MANLDDDLDLLGGGLPTEVGDLESGGGGNDDRWAGSTDQVVEKIDDGVELEVGIDLVAEPVVVEGHERELFGFRASRRGLR